MTLWDRIKAWKTQNARQLVYARIPAGQTDVAPGPPINAYEGYVRVFLSDMFLTRSRDWFTDWHPCVHTSVRLELAGQKGATIAHVARPPQQALAPGVRVNYPVTDLLPFSGDVVEIEAALLALQGKAYIEAALGLLESFSSLIPGPVGQALAIAEKVTSGLDKLVGAVDGQVHLGFHDSFGSEGGSSTLQSGYLAVVLATPEQVDPSRLGVAKHRLHILGPNGAWAPLEGFDSMLFYVEGRAQRDNWRLPSIQGPLDQAIEAQVLGDDHKADAYKKAALVAALTCKELTPRDRRRVAQAIKEELARAGTDDAGHGAVGDGMPTLESVLSKRMSGGGLSYSDDEDVPTEEEILA